MSRCLTAALLPFLLAGCETNPFAAASEVRLEVEQEEIAARGVASLRLTNHTSEELTFHPCDASVQQRTGRIWRTRSPTRLTVCQTDAPRRVAPGETRRYTLGLHDNVEPGRHRFIQSVVLEGESTRVLSSEFEVTP